jgi:hypothetical protein
VRHEELGWTFLLFLHISCMHYRYWMLAFQAFQTIFCQYINYWMSRNLKQPASKDILAHWMSLSLRKELTKNNIKKGFSTTRIWPLIEHVMDNMLVPSKLFECSREEGKRGSGNSKGDCLQLGTDQDQLQGGL